MSDETHSWADGGIFGQSVEDTFEVLDEMEEGHPDGTGGFRDSPSFGNWLGAVDAVQGRRGQKRRRETMLLVERFMDELPDVRNKIVGPNGLRGMILDRLRRRTLVREIAVAEDSIPRALGDRVRDMSLNLTAEIRDVTVNLTAEAFLRAYNRDIKRGQAAVRLGAFDPDEWARAQAQKILTAPTTLARAAVDRVSAVVARVRHVANAISEPLEKPEPEAAADAGGIA